MPFGVGIIGAGTVGGGVIQSLLANSQEIESRCGARPVLTHVCDLDPSLFEAFDLTGVQADQDVSGLIHNPEVAVVCELIGGIEPAKRFILEAMAAGKHVVTANKMLLAHHGPELCRAALEHGVELRYEAAVAGAIPIIKAIREALVGNRIKHVYGILNGTCNYILSRMTYEGLEFDDVLAQAIKLGFAESPPDLDIEGHDTAHKCQIIASLCFSTEVDLNDIHTEGITQITHSDVAYALEMGYVIKLLAIVRDAGKAIEARVHPALVPEDHLLASVRNEFNAVYVQSDAADATLYYGRGAGRLPTASAVVADIADIIQRGEKTAPPPFIYRDKRPLLDMGSTVGRYYMRLTTVDKPGVLGKVCTILGGHGVSIASCIQKEEHNEKPVHVVLMTHETSESALRAALAEIDELEPIREKTHVLRVL